MQPGFPYYPPAQGAPLPPATPRVRWWLFPVTTLAVVVLVAVCGVLPPAAAAVAGGVVLLLALLGVAVCLVRSRRWADGRAVGTGLAWALPIGFVVLLVVALTRDVNPTYSP